MSEHELYTRSFSCKISSMCFHSSQISRSVYFVTNGSVYFVTTICNIYVIFLIFLPLTHTQKQHWRSYVRGDFSYSPVKNRLMDEIDENTFMDISKIEMTNTEATTTDSTKSSIDSAMILSDSTREGSSGTDTTSTSSSVPKTFSSHLDKHGKCDKDSVKHESGKVAKADNKSDKDPQKDTKLQREISCDSVLGESKTKLSIGDKSADDKVSSVISRKSDKLKSSVSKGAIKNNDRNVGGKTDTNLVNSGVRQCQRKGAKLDEKPDIIGPDSSVEVQKQCIQEKDKKPKRRKSKDTGQTDTSNLANVPNVQNATVIKGTVGKSKLKSDKPDLLDECIKIEASKCDADNNNSMKIEEESHTRCKNTEESKSTGNVTKHDIDEKNKTRDGKSDCVNRSETMSKDKDGKVVVAEPCSDQNCTACLSGSTGRFVLPPPPRDRRVSARPGMPSIAENGIIWNICGEDSCDSGEDVFDSSTTSSTYKASLDSRSITSTTSSGAMGGVSSSGSCSSGEENGSPSPQAKCSMSRTTSDSGVETSPPATTEDAVSNGSSEARSLLDAMHKRYYPTMYQQRNRPRSDSNSNAEISSVSSVECVSAVPSSNLCSSLERNGQSHNEGLNVSHSKSTTFPNSYTVVTRPATTTSQSRIVALDRLSDSAIQAKIDAMLTHPSQKLPDVPVDEKPDKSHPGQVSPKSKYKPKADLTSSLSNPLSVLKSFSFTGITSPRPKHKFIKRKTPLRSNPLASLSPTFRRKKMAQQQQQTDVVPVAEEVKYDVQQESGEEEEDDEIPMGPCQACVFIQVSIS